MSHQLFVVLYKQHSDAQTEVVGPFYSQRGAGRGADLLVNTLKVGGRLKVYPVVPKTEVGK